MTRLRGDSVQRHAGHRGGCGIAGAQRVGGDPVGGESDRVRASLDDSRHAGGVDRMARDGAIGVHPGEHAPCRAGADVQPGAQRCQGIGISPPAFGDGDCLADGVGVAFGPAYGDQQPTRFGRDVRDVQRSEFRSAQG